MFFFIKLGVLRVLCKQIRRKKLDHPYKKIQWFELFELVTSDDPDLEYGHEVLRVTQVS